MWGTWLGLILTLACVCSFDFPEQDADLYLTWYAPFYSGGGYSSESLSFVLALNEVRFTNFSISHHGDSIRQSYYSGLTPTETQALRNYDVINRYNQFGSGYPSNAQTIIDVEICHSEPGAWHAPTPRYHTVRCPSDRRHLHSIARPGQQIVPFNIGRTMFETDRIPNGWVHRLNYMDEVWVPTEFSKDIFLRTGVEADKLTVIGEAVDSDFFKPMDYRALTPEERSTLGLPPTELISPYRTIFLFVGKFETRKGLRTLFHAYFTEFADNPDVLLLILTSAYHSNEDLYADVNALLVQERLSVEYVPRPPRYLVLTGVQQRGMPYLYSLASALVVPSHGEGWGRPHLEAMSCGTPVLATNWSGPTAFLRHEDTGYLIAIEDQLVPAEGWAGHLWAQPNRSHLQQLMRTVHEQPEQAAAVGARARQEVLAHYGLRAMGERVLLELRRIQEKVQAARRREQSQDQDQDQDGNGEL